MEGEGAYWRVQGSCGHGYRIGRRGSERMGCWHIAQSMVCLASPSPFSGVLFVDQALSCAMRLHPAGILEIARTGRIAMLRESGVDSEYLTRMATTKVF